MADRDGGSRIDPVSSTDSNDMASDIMTAEAKVVSRKAPVKVIEILEVPDNVRVVTNLEARESVKISLEMTEAGVELLKDDGLGLDFADLLGDDAFGHLLEDGETLLDDDDALGVADELLFGDDGLGEVGMGEVVNAVEVIEAREGGVASVAAERGEVIALG
jgi:hypothetical protein